MSVPPPPTSTTPPNVPQRNDPANFATRGDAFLAWLAGFGPYVSTLGDWFKDRADAIESQTNTATSAASQAGISASEASSSATTATNAANSAASSSSSAAAAEAQAEAARDAAGTSAANAAAAAQTLFNGIYLGASATDPSTDLNGQALASGDFYYNTAAKLLRVYDAAIPGFTTATPSGQFKRVTFTAGSGFTPGATTSLTLPTDPVTKSNLFVFFGGSAQPADTYSLAGLVLTFTAAIPSGVQTVEVAYLEAIGLAVPGDGTVTDDKIAANAAIASSKLALTGELAGTGAGKGSRLLGDAEVPLADYAALRAFAGAQTRVYVTGALGSAKPAGIAGTFQVDASDTTSADNGGTVIVGSDGRRWKRDYTEGVHLAWFGAQSGAFNNYAAFTSAFASVNSSLQKKIIVPAGEFNVEFTQTNCFTPPQNLILEGESEETTRIIFSPSSSSYRNCFVSSGNLTIANMKIDLNVPSGGQISLFSIPVSGLKLIKSSFNGGMTNIGAALSHNAYMINFATSGNQSDIMLDECDVSKFAYTFLKTNAATSTQKRITVAHCDFFENYRDPCQFNSPNGVMDDIQVYMCRFRDSLGASASVLSLHCSFASVTNFHVGGCHFSGPINDALHIEENSSNGTISANTFEVSGNAIALLDNNIGGTAKMPSNISITGNAIKKGGINREAGAYGIWLVNDLSSEVPAKRITITGNTVTGYDRGYLSGASTNDAIMISSNIANDCNSGYWITEGNGSINDNVSSNCDIGVTASTGGVVVRHRFVECLTPVDSGSRQGLLIDPVFEWDEFNITSGETIRKPTFETNTTSRIFADAITHVYSEVSADTATRHDSISWDGAAFTVSATRYNITMGGGFSVSQSNNTGFVQTALFSSVNRKVRMTTHYKGSFVVGI
jgi:hypothetical protein